MVAKLSSVSTSAAASRATSVPWRPIAIADVGAREGGRVVDAVARHGDDLPARLQLLDQGELAFRAHPAANRLRRKPELAADGLGGEPLIAGEHHGANARLAAARDGVLDARPHRVDEADQAEKGELVDGAVVDRASMAATPRASTRSPSAASARLSSSRRLTVRVAERDGARRASGAGARDRAPRPGRP